MENSSTQFETLFKRVEDYTNANIELLKLKAIDKSSEALASLITYRIICVAFTLFFIVLSAGFALWLGELLGKIYYGIFIVSGIYGIIALIIYNMREKIKQNICDSIISKAFN